MFIHFVCVREGVVVPAATAPGQQVVNGMSSSGRNTPWANSAIVTAVGKGELERLQFGGLFGGVDFQEYLEHKAWEEGGGGLIAPAQVLPDFLTGRESRLLPPASYKPGIRSSRMDVWFPELLYKRLVAGLSHFGRRAGGFVSDRALLLGVETRTSSPLRIPRTEGRMHPEIKGLLPAGRCWLCRRNYFCCLDGENVQKV